MSGLMRQLKLHALMGEKVSTDPRIPAIITFFDKLFEGLQVCIIPRYHKENTIYHKNGKFYMEQDSQQRWLLCRHDGFWTFFREDLRLSIPETRSVIKYMVEKYITRQVQAIGYRDFGAQLMIEKQVKQLVGTPNKADWSTHILLDYQIREHV